MGGEKKKRYLNLREPFTLVHGIIMNLQRVTRTTFMNAVSITNQFDRIPASSIQ